MKLVDLKPKWIHLPGTDYVGAPRIVIGVTFLCPHCQPQTCPTCGHKPDHKRLAVNFWPPITDCDLDRMTPIPHEKWHNRVSGETFDNLTLNPSIGFDGIGHWHGRITNGGIET